MVSVIHHPLADRQAPFFRTGELVRQPWSVGVVDKKQTEYTLHYSHLAIRTILLSNLDKLTVSLFPLLILALRDLLLSYLQVASC